MTRAISYHRRTARSIVTILTIAIVVALAWPAPAQTLSSSASAPPPASKTFPLSTSTQPGSSRILLWEIADGYYL